MPEVFAPSTWLVGAPDRLVLPLLPVSVRPPATFVEFSDATYRHLACVVCGLAAWCRDFIIQPKAVWCGYRAHRHPIGTCNRPPAPAEWCCHECGAPGECMICESCSAHCIPGRLNDVAEHHEAFEQVLASTDPKRTAS